MSMPTEYIADNHALDVDKERRINAAKRLYAKKEVTDEQIGELIPLVTKIAKNVISYIKPPLTFDDLVSAGMVGLVKAGRDFDPTHNAEFKTYASIRIRGAILDELKSWSFVSDGARKKIREAMTVSQQIEQETGQAPDDEKLAKELGVGLNDLYQTFEAGRVQNFISIDAPVEDECSLSSLIASANSIGPDHNIQKQELLGKLAEAISELDEKQRQLILLYYQQNLTMKQIAEVFDITEARVSQIHSSAIFNLSVKLSEWKNG